MKTFMLSCQELEDIQRASPADDSQTAAMVKKMIRSKILVTSEVRIVDYGLLERSFRKTKRVFDNREG